MRTCWVSPFAAWRWGLVAASTGSCRDNRHESREVFGREFAVNHPQQRCCGGVSAGLVVGTHSGMFPCFFGGKDTRLVRNRRSALTISARVSEGRITPSM